MYKSEFVLLKYTHQMSVTKLVNCLIKDDLKGFESELNEYKFPKGTSNEFNVVLSLIAHKGDVAALKIVINCLEYVDVKLHTAMMIRPLAENNHWEMLKILVDSPVFYVNINLVLDVDNLDVPEKVLEHKILTQLELEACVHRIPYVTSPKMYKKLMLLYPGIYKVETYRKVLLNTFNSRQSFEVFAELTGIVTHAADIKMLCNSGLDVQRYNVLVQKVPQEVIINHLLNPTDIYNFDTALIDIIGIRDRLQAKIDEAEGKFDDAENIKPFSPDFICYSGLDFRKKVLMENIMLPYDRYKMILSNLRDDYFSNVEKSNWLVELVQSNRIVPLAKLSKFGWKIYDSPENQAKCVDRIELYNKIPKY